MNRDDAVTFGLALVAAILTFLLMSTGKIQGSLMFVVAFVVFGAMLFGKSFVQSAY